MQPLHVRVKTNAIVVSCTVACHQDGGLRVTIVTNRPKHVDLQALIQSLLPTRDLATLVEFWAYAGGCLKLFPYSTLLRRY